MSTRKSTTKRKRKRNWLSGLRPWLALLRHYAEGRELSRSLRESILMDDEGWVWRDSQGGSATLLDYVEGGDSKKNRFQLSLLPCTCCRSLQTVRVAVNGTTVWIPPLARLLLRNVVRLAALKYANKVADTALGN